METANKIKVTADKYVILEGNKIEILAKDKISKISKDMGDVKRMPKR